MRDDQDERETVEQALRRLRMRSDELHSALARGAVRARTPLVVASRNTANRDPDIPAPARFLCHLVLQGGGMHGAAHAGFIAALEHGGVRFAGVAGASAGAIVAMALVCARGDNPFNTVGGVLTDLVRSVPADSFIDGPFYARQMIKRFLLERNLTSPLRWPSLLKIYQRLLRVRGLNPGSVFENWLATRLRQDFQIATISALQARLKRCHGILSAHWAMPDPERMLQLMAASLPIGIKLTLPMDLHLFEINQDQTSPAALVRASMSIPVFFEPVAWRLDKAQWRQEVSTRLDAFATGGAHKAAAEFSHLQLIDGGVFSNLPLYAFADGTNSVPTLAVSLIQDPPTQKPVRFRSSAAMGRDLASLLSAIKAQRDRDAYATMQHGSLSHLVSIAPVDVSGISWLNFMATAADMDELYRRGVVAAANAFESWI